MMEKQPESGPLSTGSLALEFKRDAGLTLFTLRGQLNGSNCVLLSSALAEHLIEDDRLVVLDCTELTFISSAGLREFLNLAKRLNKHKQKAALAGLGASVSLALEIAGFNTLFHRVNDVAAARQILSLEAAPKSGLLGRLFG